MGKTKFVLILGVLNIIVPFLGLPSSWKTVIFILIGLGLIALAYALRDHKKSAVAIKEESFVES